MTIEENCKQTQGAMNRVSLDRIYQTMGDYIFKLLQKVIRSRVNTMENNKRL